MIDPHHQGTETAPTAGIDWSSTEHAVAVVDGRGEQLQRFTITHTAPGLPHGATHLPHRRRGRRPANHVDVAPRPAHRPRLRAKGMIGPPLDPYQMCHQRGRRCSTSASPIATRAQSDAATGPGRLDGPVGEGRSQL